MAIAFCVIFVCAPASFAQGGVKTGPDPALIRDPEIEKDSLHNLEVAKNYFKLKKAYVAALMRLEEVIAGNPTFSKIEEVYLLAGQASLRLAEGKGKQSSEKYMAFGGESKRTITPEELRTKGREYLSVLVNDFPNGQFSKQAAEELRAVGGPFPKQSNP
jgi:hypothetical protein